MSNLISEVQLHAITMGVLLPSLVASIAFLISGFLPHFLRGPIRATSVALAVGVAYISLLGLPDWPILGSPKGILIGLAVSILWASFEQLSQKSHLGRRILVTGLVGLGSVYPLISGAWNLQSSIQNGLLISTLATCVWWIIERGSLQMRSAGYLATLTNWVAVSSGFMMLEGSASLAQVAGAFSAALGVVMLLAIFQKLKPEYEYTSLSVLTMTALWCCHYFYVDSSWQTLVYSLTPLMWFVIRGLMTWMPSPIKDLTVSSIVSLIPAGYGLWHLYVKSMFDSLQQ